MCMYLTFGDVDMTPGNMPSKGCLLCKIMPRSTMDIVAALMM